jgi:hypothetical protein
VAIKDDQPARPVWARRQVVAFRCPKSIITAQSRKFIEQFGYWKGCGGDLWSFDAKTADALLALEEQIAMENKNEQQKL